MPESPAAKLRRQRAQDNFRLRMAEAGQSQVQVWLPDELREQLDSLVKSGRYRNRSEIFTDALTNMLEDNGNVT